MNLMECDIWRIQVLDLHYKVLSAGERFLGEKVEGTATLARRLQLPKPWPRRLRELDIVKGYAIHMTPVRSTSFYHEFAALLSSQKGPSRQLPSQTG